MSLEIPVLILSNNDITKVLMFEKMLKPLF